MKLAIYDFDGTYVHIQTLPYLYKLWKQEGLNKSSYRKIWGKILRRFILYKLPFKGWDKQRFRQNAMELTADLLHSVDEQSRDQFLKLFHDKLQAFIPKGIKTQLQQDKKDGYVTVLLSGNYDIILEPFLDDGFDYIIGTTLVDNGKKLTSKEVEIIIHNRKSERIKDMFVEADFEKSKAYADSGYDLPILELVGHPVVVQGDEMLRAYALEQEWEILDFTV